MYQHYNNGYNEEDAFRIASEASLYVETRNSCSSSRNDERITKLLKRLADMKKRAAKLMDNSGSIIKEQDREYAAALEEQLREDIEEEIEEEEKIEIPEFTEGLEFKIKLIDQTTKTKVFPEDMSTSLVYKWITSISNCEFSIRSLEELPRDSLISTINDFSKTIWRQVPG